MMGRTLQHTTHYFSSRDDTRYYALGVHSVDTLLRITVATALHDAQTFPLASRSCVCVAIFHIIADRKDFLSGSCCVWEDSRRGSSLGEMTAVLREMCCQPQRKPEGGCIGTDWTTLRNQLPSFSPVLSASAVWRAGAAVQRCGLPQGGRR